MNRSRAFLRRVQHAWAASIDLVAVVSLVALTNLVVFSPVVNGPLVRALLGIPFVLFVPGYALVAALYPEARSSPAVDEGGEPGGTVHRFVGLGRDGWAGGIDGVERIALALGLSIALVPIFVVGSTVTPFEFSVVPIVLTIDAVTIGSATIAALRRWATPAEDRFRVPLRAWIVTATRLGTRTDSRFHATLNVALALAIVLAVGTLAYAVLVPPDGEHYSEFYVLTENDSGELVATSQPDSLTPGEPERVHVGIENYEEETVEYSVVVQLQRPEETADGATGPDRGEVDRFSTTLAHNETSIQERELNVSGELTGEDLRLTFLLYRGAPPETPTRENAYRRLHLWVDVGSA